MNKAYTVGVIKQKKRLGVTREHTTTVLICSHNVHDLRYNQTRAQNTLSIPLALSAHHIVTESGWMEIGVKQGVIVLDVCVMQMRQQSSAEGGATFQCKLEM